MMRIVFALAFVFFLCCSPRYVLDFSSPIDPVKLPHDNRAHYQYQMEWWYYTGHLTGDDGSRYGFEVTFFKRIMNEDRAPFYLCWMPAYWIKDVGMIGHFAVTDIGRKKFSFDHITNIFSHWKADPEKYHLEINGWAAKDVGGSHHIQARMEGYDLDLKLVPDKPPVLHGPGGIVAKGDCNANYYYSYTRLAAEGAMVINGARKKVAGTAWMDHEYGTMKLVRTQKGWDWFSIQLDDNTEIMLYIIKNKNNTVSESGGTYVSADGKTRWLQLSDMDIKVTDRWHSKKTETTYPSQWEINIRPLDITIRVAPMVPHQELIFDPITYWEGAVTVEGLSSGKKVRGRGYVELVGYNPERSFTNLSF